MSIHEPSYTVEYVPNVRTEPMRPSETDLQSFELGTIVRESDGYYWIVEWDHDNTCKKWTRLSPGFKFVNTEGERIVVGQSLSRSDRVSGRAKPGNQIDNTMMNALVDAYNAWVNPGINKGYHERMKENVRQDMPILATRMDYLANMRKGRRL